MGVSVFCKLLRTYLIYMGAPVLGPYIFRIVRSSCCINPLTIMYYPSLSLLIFVTLKSILSDVTLATPTFFFLLSICLVNLPLDTAH